MAKPNLIQKTTAQLTDICDTSKTDTPAVFNDDELLYIDPVKFEAYVKTQRAELWPCEFRQARDIINDYAQRSAGNVADDGTPHEEIFKAALICLQALALEMIPEHADEIKTEAYDDLNILLPIKYAAKYLCLTVSGIYKLTSDRKIPFCKPFGNKLYFKRRDLLTLIRKKYSKRTNNNNTNLNK